MEEIVERIRELIDEARGSLQRIPPEDTAARSGPKVWSKKEVIGHLIDSAANNHQRIVRAAQNLAGDFPTYDQVAWVAVQRYNGIPWEEILDLWYSYNRHLCRIISNIPREALSSPCNIGKGKPVSLELVITDYLRHLQHHLDKVLSRS